MKKVYVTKLLLVWVLPILLLLFTWILFGCYYESNDDVAISQVIRGETALAPVADLHLYFHGLASVLATLYRIWPAIPWYGLLLYLLLYVSLVLVYQVLYDVLAGKVSVLSLACCLILIYWFAWQQTALLINFTRLPILLAGTGILYATSQRKHFFSLAVGLAVVMLGWCIRPSAAILGLLVAIPGAWWLAGYRAFLPVISAGAIMAVAAGVLALTYSRSENTRQRIDVGNAYYLDYALYQPQPVTAADSLGVLSVANWAFGDSTVVNEQLYEQSFRFDKDLFPKQRLPRKAMSTYYMVREHCVWFVFCL
ncbi:hypothetical protein [Hymenobacter sp. YC55]|uniref:hypothetical protein n=1 Tax=Hymenobacter sp. YC55 TaxID=3034019 RepID=UPI0023F94091|nr:hypothetical protein [Hymenobacter sp. YC55]MDF7811237.1 hypothetical protein [Hymenobacter sp. YC55]